MGMKQLSLQTNKNIFPRNVKGVENWGRQMEEERWQADLTDLLAE